MQTYNSFLKYKLHASKQRPWNFEIPVTFFHSDNREFNFVMSFPSKPTVEEIQAAIDLWVQEIGADEQEEGIPPKSEEMKE